MVIRPECDIIILIRGFQSVRTTGILVPSSEISTSGVGEEGMIEYVDRTGV